MDDNQDIIDEERQPLNAMVTENLKNVIISRLYKDVEKRTRGRQGSRTSQQKKDYGPDRRQYFAASGPIISGLSSGMCAGFSAILLPHLYSEATEIAITKQEGSWIASMLALPLAIGCFFSGYVMDKLGRKLGLLLCCVPFSVGWLILAVASNVPELYVGRFVTGFSMGLMSPMCQVYVAETSAPQHRGILLSGAPLSVALGILLAHVFGTFLHWRIAAGLCGLPPIICIALLIFAKESPSWLLSRGRTEEAERAYRWFRGHSDEATNELNNLLSAHQAVATVDKTNTEHPSQLKLFFQPSFFKPFIVLNVFFFVQQFSGVNAIAFYTVTILKEVLTDVDEYMATIGIDLVRFIVSIIAILLLKRFGRKTLSIASAIGTAISLFVLAAHLGFYDPSAFPKDDAESFQAADLLNYIPLVALISFITFVSIGIVPIPWVLTGELFSKEMRGVGSGATSCFGFLCYFLVVKTTPDLFEAIGSAGTFCIFGVVTIVGSVLLALYLPETKDKTLAEIEAFYTRGKQEEEEEEEDGQQEEPEVISIRF